MLLIKASATVTVYRGHRRTLFFHVSFILSPRTMCKECKNILYWSPLMTSVLYVVVVCSSSAEAVSDSVHSGTWYQLSHIRRRLGPLLSCVHDCPGEDLPHHVTTRYSMADEQKIQRLRPRPHQQQCRSDGQHWRRNVRLCNHKRQQCRTILL